MATNKQWLDSLLVKYGSNSNAQPWNNNSLPNISSARKAELDKTIAETQPKNPVANTPKSFGTNTTAIPYQPVSVYGLTPQQYRDQAENSFNSANARSQREALAKQNALRSAVAFNNALPQTRLDAYQQSQMNPVNPVKTYDPAAKASKQKERETVNNELNALRERQMGGDIDPTLPTQIQQKKAELSVLDNDLLKYIDYNLDPKQYGSKFDEMSTKGGLTPGNPLKIAEMLEATGNPDGITEIMGGHLDKADYYRYTLMTPDQRKLYHAFYADDPKKAEAYLDSLSVGNNYIVTPPNNNPQIVPNIAERAAEKAYNELPGGIRGAIQKTGLSLSSGINSALDNTFNGMVDAARGNVGYQPISADEYLASEITNNAGVVGKVWYDIMQSTGNMLPGIALSAATSGLGAGATMAQFLGDTVFALSQAGGAYRDAIRGGSTVSQARGFAFQQGIDETATNFLLGGIEKFGGGALRKMLANSESGKTLVDAITKIAKTEQGQAVLGRVMAYIADMGSEATQEFVQYFTEGLSRQIFLGEDFNPNVLGENGKFSESALYAAALGALNAGLLNLGTPARDVMSSANLNTNYAEAFKNYKMPTEDMQETGDKLAKISQNINDKTANGEKANLIDRLGRGIAENDFNQAQTQYAIDQKKALDKGEINQETFDNNMLKLGIMNAVTSNDTYYEREEYDGKDSSGRQTDGQDDLDGGGGSSKVQSRAEQAINERADTVNGIRTQAKDEGWDLDSSSGMGVENGTTDKTLYRVSDDYIEKGGTELARELRTIRDNAAQLGKKVSFVVGSITVSKDGDTYGVRGVFQKNGDIIIRADSDSASATQIYKHESFHSAKLVNPNIVADTKRRYLNTHTEEELTNTLIDYAQRYRYNVFDDKGNFSMELFNKSADYILEEVLADAYANMPQVTAELDKSVHDIRKAAKREMNYVTSAENTRVAQETAQKESEAMALKKAEETKTSQKSAIADAVANKGDIDNAVKNATDLTAEEIESAKKMGRDKIVADKKAKGFKRYEKRGQHSPKASYSKEYGEDINSSRSLKRAGKKVKGYDIDKSGSVVYGNTKRTVTDGVSPSDLSGTIFEAPKYSRETYNNPYPKEMLRISGNDVEVVKDKKTKMPMVDVLSGRDFLIKKMSENNISKNEQEKVLNLLDTASQKMEEWGLKYTYVNLEDINKAKIIINQRDGSIVLRALVKNGEYPINIDLTKECEKRVAFGKFINKMANEKGKHGKKSMLDEISLSEANIIEMNKVLRDAGFDTACLGCFVEARRYHIEAWANDVLTSWNDAVDKIKPGAKYFNFGDKDVSIEMLNTKELSKLNDELESYKTKGTPNTKIVSELMEDMIKNNPSLQKKLRIGDLISTNGRTNLHRYSPEMESLVVRRWGTASPKSVETFTPYNYELSSIYSVGGQSLQDYVKYIAGVREQSFSDYIATHFMDVMEKTADLAINRLNDHTYTKQPWEVRIFGKTGRKFNMSIMFNVDGDADAAHAGLRPNGEYFVGDKETSEEEFKKTGNKTFVQSFPYKEALEIQHKDGYSKNCGMIGVGYSWYHIKKLLADKEFGYIIGYHKSNEPGAVQIQTHLDQATNYENVQNTCKINGLSKVVGDFYGVPSYATWKEGVKTKSAKNVVDTDMTIADFDIKKHLDKYGGAKTMKMLLEWLGKNNLTVNVSKAQGGVGDFPLYQDLEKTKNPKKTADNYITWCLEQGFLPEFFEFADDPNYFNFIYDFTTYDHNTGKFAPQLPVKMEFPDNVFDLAEESISEYNEYHKQQQPKEAETFEKMYEIGRGEQRHSKELDDTYLQAVENKDMETAQKMVDEKAKASGYPIKAYHATDKDFNTFDSKKSGENFNGYLKYGAGFYFAPTVEGTKQYGKKVKSVYLSTDRILDAGSRVENEKALNYLIDNGMAKGDALWTMNYGDRFVNALFDIALKDYTSYGANFKVQELLKEFGYDAVGDVYDFSKGKGQVVIFDANQVKSADPVTYDDKGKPIPLSKRFNQESNDIRYSKEIEKKAKLVGNKELVDRDDVAVYVKDSKTAKYAEKIFAKNVDDRKTLETRDNRKLDEFIGKPYEITDGNYVWGKVIFGEPFPILAEEFHDEKYQKKHQVPKNDKYDVKPGSFKWAYPIKVIERYDEPRKLNKDKSYNYSFQAREVKFSKEIDSVGNKLTNNQQKYFVESKVRDEDGKLLKVYHGSPSTDITKFDKSKVGQQTKAYNDKAFWFTTDKKFADDFSYEMLPGSSAYTYKRGAKGKVYEGYLNIINPFDFNNLTDDMKNMLFENAKKMGFYDNKTEFLKEVDKLLGYGNHQMLKMYLDFDALESNGYDGVIARIDTKVNGNDNLEYGVLNSNQFKNIDNLNPTADEDTRFSREVTDKKTLDFLNNQDYVTAYRCMQVIDGKLYPPMAAKVNGKLTNPSRFEHWEMSEENPSLVKYKTVGDVLVDPNSDDIFKGKDGKWYYKIEDKEHRLSIDIKTKELATYFVLNKGVNSATGKKATDVPARYNPYIHTSMGVLNDQFSSAWIRPNLVVVEVRIPKSELTSGYKAKYAKDSVGAVDWKDGPVSEQLAALGKPRRVTLSRYDMPVRIVPEKEVARMIKKSLKGTDIQIPENTLTPKLKAELEKIGVKIGEPQKGYNKTEQIAEAIERGLTVIDGAKLSREITPEMIQNAKPRYTAEEMNWQIGKTKGIEREKADMRLKKANEKSSEKIANLKAENKSKIAETKADEKAKRESQMMALKKAGQDKLDKQKAKYEEKLEKLDEKRRSQVEAERETKRKRIAEEQQRHRDYVLKKREMKAEAKARQRLLAWVRRSLKETKGKPGLVASRIMEIANSIDNKAVRILPSTKEELEARRDEIRKLEAEDYDFAKLHAARMLKTVDRLEKKSISEYTLEDVMDITEELATLVHYQETQDKLIKDKQNRKASDMANSWVDELKGYVKSLDKTSPIKKFSDYLTNSLSPLRAMRRISGYKTDSVGENLMRSNLEGETKLISLEKKFLEPFDEFVNDKKAKKFVKNAWKPTIEITAEGKKYLISPAMRVSLYMHSMNEDNLTHIAGGGINIPNAKLYKKGDIVNAYGSGDIVHLTPTEILNITQEMSPEEVRYAELLQNFFIEAADAINETSLDLDGVMRALVDNYFPISTDKNFLAKDLSFMNDPTTEGWGNLKARTEGAKNPILLEDATKVLERHIRKTAQYAALAVPLRNFQKVFNYTAGAKFDANSDAIDFSSVRKAMNDAWDAETVKYVEQLLLDMNTGGRDSSRGKLENLRSAYASATLTLNPSVALKQTTSYFMAGSILSNKSLAYGLIHKFTKADEAYMDSITPWGWNRRRGQSSIEIGDMAKKQGLTSKIPNWNQAMDVITTNALFIATERDIQKEYPNLKRGDAQYDKALADRYNEVLWRTQPQYGVAFRPEYLRRTDVMSRTLGMFKTESMQMTGELIDAIGQYNADKTHGLDTTESKKTLYKTLGSWTASNLAFAAMGAVLKFALHNIKGYRDDEGEMDPSLVLKEILSGFVSSSAGGFFGGSAVYDVGNFLVKKASGENAQWYDIEAPGLSLVNDLVQSAGNLAAIFDKDSTPEQVTKAVTRFALDVSKFTPVGFAENVYKMADAVNLYIQDISNGELLSYEGGTNLLNLKDTTVTSKQYTTRTVNAFADGDDERGKDAWNKLINQVGLDKAENKVRSALREDLKSEESKGIAYSIIENSNDENIRDIAIKLIYDYEKDSKQKPSTVEVIESLNISNADKGKVYAESSDSQKLKTWRDNGGSEYDYYVATQKLAPSIPKEDEDGKDVDSILYVMDKVESGEYTQSQADAWLNSKAETQSYELWSDAGGTDKDYFTAYSEIKAIKAKKLKDDLKKSQIVSLIKGYIKKSNDPEKTARALWTVADYQFDSTKDKKKVEDGNFLKAFPQFKKAKDLRLKKY